MKKILFAAAAMLILTACKKEEPVSSVSVSDSTIVIQDTAKSKKVTDSAANTSLKLGKFGFPPEVEGCSCYFAENKADFEKQHFIYVDDYGNNATIKIGTNTIKIPMEEGDFDPANFSKTVENGEYKIEMNGKKIDEGDETMLFQGTIKVTDLTNGQIFSSAVYGECGC